jgi:hypothetical protein
MDRSTSSQHHAIDPDRLGDAALVANADHHQALFSHHQREFFRRIAVIDRRRLWEADGCRDIAQWISGRYHVPTYRARLWIGAAHALDELPLISKAFEAGDIGIDKTVQLARFATPATEKYLLRWAKRVTARTIRRKADRAERRAISETAEVDKDRSLTWWLFDDDRRVAIEALLPAAEGMMAVKAIERLAERKLKDPDIDESAQGSEDPAPTIDQRRADALVELCSQSIDADFDADRATVIVHAELSAILGDGTGCEIDGGPVIHAEVVRRMLCDGRLESVITDGDRGVVGLGRASREPSPHLYRKVLQRDGGCTFPGCGSRRYIHAHHIWHWIYGGPTDLDNLTIVCGFHHRLIHERGWHVHVNDDGSTIWFRPDGAVYDPGRTLEAMRGDTGPPRAA